MQPNASTHRGWHSRGFLPHCDFPGLIQSVSVHLFDSVPVEVLERWIRELDTECDKKSQAKLRSRIEHYEDMGYGNCFLSDANVARLVEDALLYFDGERYDILAWCIMPNHLHSLFVPRLGYSLTDIVQNWKSYTAHQANKWLRRSGEFWFPDYFDEFMKTTKQLEATIDYIELNPVTARLTKRREQWLYSSAATNHVERVRANRLKFPEVDATQLPDF